MVLEHAEESQTDSHCNLEMLRISCSELPLGGSVVMVTGSINVCSQPASVTLLVQSLNHTWSWQHTFVNEDEVQLLQGPDEYVTVHVQLIEHLHLVHVTAGLLVENQEGVFIVNTGVARAQSDGCSVPSVEIMPLVLVCVLCVVLVLLAVLVFVWWYRRSSRRRNNCELLDDMQESPSLHSSREELISTSVLIRNSLYSTGEPLPCIPEEDADGATAFINFSEGITNPAYKSSSSSSHHRRLKGKKHDRLARNHLKQLKSKKKPEIHSTNHSKSKYRRAGPSHTEVDARAHPASHFQATPEAASCESFGRADAV